MTQIQQPYDEWNQEVTLFLADHVDHWLKRALEELRKRDRALEIAKKALSLNARLDSFSPHRDCTGKEHFRQVNHEALQQIEEVLK